MRKRHDRSWWQSTVTAWESSGQRAEAFGADHDVHPASLRWWRRRLELDGAEAPPAEFALLRVELAGGAPVPAVLCAIVGPAELRFEVGADVGYVAGLVAAIAQAVGRC